MIYEGLWVRDQKGRVFLLVVTCWTWFWVVRGGGGGGGGRKDGDGRASSGERNILV